VAEGRGSNPLLSLALEGQDQVHWRYSSLRLRSLPIIEEFLFRGFVTIVDSLLAGMGSVVVAMFAVAHLSLSEILPLTVLGMVLGWVYTRDRNLLAPMLPQPLE